MEKLLIFPFNGNGLEALDCVGERYEFLGYLDDTPEKQGKHPAGFEVFPRSALARFPDAKVLAVPGGPATYTKRDEIIHGLGLAPERFATVIHPRASISPLAKVGFNFLAMAGVVLTSNCQVGNHVCLLPNTVVHHDSAIDDYTLIGANVTVAGCSRIGHKCYIGSGTSIINGITIGDDVLIALGSTVIRSVDAGERHVGNPSRRI